MKNEFSAHSGHAGNSGIQSHFCGPDWPIITVCVGGYPAVDNDAFFRLLHRGKEYDCADHAERDAVIDRLKRADKITETICDARSKGTGCSNWISCDDAPDCGYVVGLKVFETQLDVADSTDREIHADVVDKLEYLDARGPVVADYCIGSWIHGGSLYVDVGVVYADRDAALDAAFSNGQIAIWDLTEDFDIDVPADYLKRNN